MTWVAILGCAAGCYLLKLAGMSVPQRLLDRPALRRVTDLLPVVLLAALIAVQVFSTEGAHGPRLVVDARLAGLGAALVALLMRAPFIVVVVLAAVAAAVVRALGWSA